MTLLEILKPDQLEQLKEMPIGTINFKNKTKFMGISHKPLGGAGQIYLSLEMLTSDQWGWTFECHDKKFNEALFGLVGKPQSKSEPDAIDHPCRETCSGWMQGFRRAKQELEQKYKTQIEMLIRTCESFEKASKNKQTKSIAQWMGRYYKSQPPVAEKE